MSSHPPRYRPRICVGVCFQHMVQEIRNLRRTRHSSFNVCVNLFSRVKRYTCSINVCRVTVSKMSIYFNERNCSFKCYVHQYNKYQY